MTRFAAGQVWTYRDALSDRTRAIIGRVEDVESEPVIHVSITEVPLPEDIVPGGATVTIAHAPFGLESFANSVLELESTDAQMIEGFEGGYQEWATEESGYYTVTVAESIAMVFDALSEEDEEE